MGWLTMKLKLPHLDDSNLDIDAKIEEVVKKNFDTNSGAEYWIDYAANNRVSPKDITCYDDLHHLGFHDWRVFKEGIFTRLIPRDDRKLFFKSSSSGTTGQKKVALLPESFLRSSNRWWSYNLSQVGLPEEPRCWGVGSPEFWGKNVEYGIRKSNGLFLPVYVESRGAKQFMRSYSNLMNNGKESEAFQKLMDRYLALIEDTINVFLAVEPNIVVAPAAVLLEHLPRILSMDQQTSMESIELVVCGGDELTPSMYHALGDAFPSARILPYFGHFMVGAAFGHQGLNYYPNASGVLLDVVDSEGEKVDYGGRGRCVVNFFDTILWRAKDDFVRRVKPRNNFKWDGVSDISRHEK